ncbi:cysteine proteinase 1-like [Lineus longissimus]|uniref:cysteine proteinase 1-like n=1 Tax=Lineus longissimus TaxID=88925 RepID=UPI002B4DF176
MTSSHLWFVACVLMMAAVGQAAMYFSFDQHQDVDFSEDEMRELFGSWKGIHGKFYKTLEKDEERFQVFQENVRKIISLNKEYEGRELKFAPNKFADLSYAEFRSKILMPKREAPVHPNSKYTTTDFNAPLPTAFDWNEKGMVTDVKDQGSGGTCWAFSTIGNIEGQWAMAGHNLTSLSVEQVVDCDGGEDVPKGRADCGVFGGWPYLAYQFIQKVGGLETEADYKYCAGAGGAPGTCFVCAPPGFNKTLCGPPVWWCNVTCFDKLDKTKFVPGLNVTGWKAIDQNETTMAHQLMETGPLSVALNAELLQFYHSGVFDPIMCNPKTLDHAVLITGFGVHSGWFGNTPYWVVKNSWGPKWGLKGYFWIKRGAGICGINTAVTTAQLKH